MHLLISALALTVAVAAGPAWGYGYTPFSDPPLGEDSHLDIVSMIYAGYGGSFAADGLGFTNAAEGITVKRVYDTNGPEMSLHIVLGDETGVDQIWTDGTATVTATAKFADLTQSFGWNNNGGDVGAGYVLPLGHPAQRGRVVVLHRREQRHDGPPDHLFRRGAAGRGGRRGSLAAVLGGPPLRR